MTVYLHTHTNMKDQEILDLTKTLESVGINGPLSRFGSDLDDVVEVFGKYRKGARAFLDPVTGARYISHANGYVRRYMLEKNYWRTGKDLISRYPLNKRFTKNIDNYREYDERECILIPDEEDRLKLIARAVINYRKNRGKV